MRDAGRIRWAPGWLKLFARSTAALVILATLAIVYEAAGGAAFATTLFILPLFLALAVAMCVARRTAIVLPLAMVPWVLVAVLIGFMRHWPVC